MGYAWPSRRLPSSLIVEKYGFFSLDAGQWGTKGPFSRDFTFLEHDEYAVWKDVSFCTYGIAAMMKLLLGVGNDL
jgi:hypothetical protein